MPDRPPLVLVVDDDPALRSVLQKVLRAAGYETAEAADGTEAEAECVRLRPALVLLDIYMPGRDGIETLLALRDRWPTLPVIVTSGGDDVGYRGNLDDAVAFGATAAIPKPFEVTELVQLVRRTLAGA